MSEKTPAPVPDLAYAFEGAVAALDYWNMGGPEPKVKYGAHEYSIGEIADRVAAPGSLAGNAPDNVYELVCRMAVEFASGEEGYEHDCSGPVDHSYVRVAECLRRLYDARVARHKRRAEKRKSQEPA